jgi:hypothetical protein
VKVSAQLILLLTATRTSLAQKIDAETDGLNHFICHEIEDVFEKIWFGNEPGSKELRRASWDMKSDVLKFISAGIDTGEGTHTFSSWLLHKRVPWRLSDALLNDYGLRMYIANQARLAWLDRLLYFIELGATEILPDGRFAVKGEVFYRRADGQQSWIVDFYNGEIPK